MPSCPSCILKIYELYGKGEMETARQIQNEACRIIYKMCTAKRATCTRSRKAIIRLQGVPAQAASACPCPPGRRRRIHRAEAAGMISAAIGKYC